MSRHELWHVLVLSSTMLGSAGAAILLLSSLVFEAPPPGLQRGKPAAVGLICLAGLVLIVEWLVVH
jgi:hypothetical protein